MLAIVTFIVASISLVHHRHIASLQWVWLILGYCLDCWKGLFKSDYLKFQILDCVGQFGYVLALLVTATADKRGTWVRDSLVTSNSIMYPGYKDTLYLTKLFLNTLIKWNVMKQWSMADYSKLLRKRKNKRSLCESEVEGVWEDECFLWSNWSRVCTVMVH